MRRTPGIPLLALLGTLTALAPLPARAELEWLRDHPWECGPVPQGAHVSLEIEGGAAHLVGEGLPARLVLENVGEAPFVALFDGFQDAVRGSRLPAVTVEATDEAGAALPDPYPEELPGIGNGPVGCVRLSPGDKIALDVHLDLYLRLVRPGRYEVRVSAPWGWEADPARPLPVAEAFLTLRLPDEEEARRVVDAALAEGDGGSRGRPGSLRLPLYVPWLAERLAAGEIRAVDGLAGIPGEEASAALLAATSLPDGALVRAAAEALARRDLSGCAEAARERMRALLSVTGDGRTGSTAAGVLVNLGGPEDARAVVDFLDRVLPLAPERDVDGLSPGWPPSDLWGAVEALGGLAAKGAPAPSEPRWAGGILLYLAHASSTDPRLADADERCLAWLHHRVPYVRERALRAISEAALPRALPAWEDLSNDRDGGVRLAAFERFAALGRVVQGGGSTNTVRTAASPSLLGAASKMALAQGLRPHLVDAWIDRLVEPEMVVTALGGLADVLLEPETISSSLGRPPPPAESVALAEAWRRFAREHAQEIIDGKRWRMGEPGLDPALFAPWLHFGRADGTLWPPER